MFPVFINLFVNTGVHGRQEIPTSARHVRHAFDPSTWEAEVRRLQVPGQHGLQGDNETSRGYIEDLSPTHPHLLPSLGFQMPSPLTQTIPEVISWPD